MSLAESLFLQIGFHRSGSRGSSVSGRGPPGMDLFKVNIESDEHCAWRLLAS